MLRNLPVFGYTDRLGHGEVLFDDVRVPAANLLGAAGDGFAMAQARLGPGRMHYAMRAIGMAERAQELMCRRVTSRVAFGGPLADQGVVREWIARSRIEIDQARLLVLKAAWLMDTRGNKAARTEVAEIKVAALDVAHRVIDRALQAHGGPGSATTSRWPGCTPASGRCGSPTGRTRCTCAPWPAASWRSTVPEPARARGQP